MSRDRRVLPNGAAWPACTKAVRRWAPTRRCATIAPMKYRTSPAAARTPSSGTANPASSPAVTAASRLPSTGTHERGMRFMSACFFG